MISVACYAIISSHFTYLANMNTLHAFNWTTIPFRAHLLITLSGDFPCLKITMNWNACLHCMHVYFIIDDAHCIMFQQYSESCIIICVYNWSFVPAQTYMIIIFTELFRISYCCTVSRTYSHGWLRPEEKTFMDTYVHILKILHVIIPDHVCSCIIW